MFLLNAVVLVECKLIIPTDHAYFEESAIVDLLFYVEIYFFLELEDRFARVAKVQVIVQPPRCILHVGRLVLSANERVWIFVRI